LPLASCLVSTSNLNYEQLRTVLMRTIIDEIDRITIGEA